MLAIVILQSLLADVRRQGGLRVRQRLEREGLRSVRIFDTQGQSNGVSLRFTELTYGSL